MKKVYLFLSILIYNSAIAQLCDFSTVNHLDYGQCNSDPWLLVFEDNFDGTSLDLTKWKLKEDSQGSLQGSTDFQYYSLDNVSVSSGNCHITAKQETVTDKYAVNWRPPTDILSDGLPNYPRSYNYTSSYLVSKNKFSYGKYEIRCKIPYGKGLWPAFWMFGQPFGIKDELDVFEFWPENNIFGNYDPTLLCKKPNMTIHRGSNFCQTDYLGPDYSQAFHTFTIIWDDYRIEWYVDGFLRKKVNRYYLIDGTYVECTEVVPGIYYRNNTYPTHDVYLDIIVNLAVFNTSGTNGPDSGTPFPGSLEIDYIKFWRQKPCGNDVNYTSTDQLNLESYPQALNTISGTTITAGTNVVVSTNIDCKMEANNKITLLPGFTAETGSHFTAIIDPLSCYKSFIPNSENETEKNEYKINNPQKPIDEYTEIEIYPNPSSGNFIVEFKNSETVNYNIKIFNSQGKEVLENLSITDIKTQFNLSKLSNGLYYICIHNTNREELITRTIMIQ